MIIKPLICKKCGAPLEVIPGLKLIKCKHCGVMYEVIQNQSNLVSSEMYHDNSSSPTNISIRRIRNRDVGFVGTEWHIPDEYICAGLKIASICSKQFITHYDLTVKATSGWSRFKEYKKFLGKKRDYEPDSMDASTLSQNHILLAQRLTALGLTLAEDGEIIWFRKGEAGWPDTGQERKGYTGRLSVDPDSSFPCSIELTQKVNTLLHNPVVEDMAGNIISHFSAGQRSISNSCKYFFIGISKDRVIYCSDLNVKENIKRYQPIEIFSDSISYLGDPWKYLAFNSYGKASIDDLTTQYGLMIALVEIVTSGLRKSDLDLSYICRPWLVVSSDGSSSVFPEEYSIGVLFSQEYVIKEEYEPW